MGPWRGLSQRRRHTQDSPASPKSGLPCRSQAVGAAFLPESALGAVSVAGSGEVWDRTRFKCAN